MKKSWFTNILFIGCLLVTILLIVFILGYRLWFSNLMCSPIEQKEIVLRVADVHAINYMDEHVIVLSNDQWQQFVSNLEDINKYNNYTNTNFLTVSHLNGFYASIFAAIMIFIALVALVGWKRFMQNSEKVEILEELVEKLKWLNQKKEDAEWIRNKFNSEDINSSYKLNLFKNDQERLEKMKEHLMDEHEHEGWREILIAHEYVSKKDVTEADLTEAEKIYKSIELRNVFKEDSALEPLLYHLEGQLYKRKFDLENKKQSNILELENTLLLKSKEYYEKSLKLQTENAQTFGNLAVVLIELFKVESAQKQTARSYLLCAQTYLRKQKNISDKSKKFSISYHYWWDRARVEFYLNEKENRIKNSMGMLDWKNDFINNIINMLNSVVDDINNQEDEENKKNREFFIDKVTEEFNEKEKLMNFDIMAFPGKPELIKSLRTKLKMDY